MATLGTGGKKESTEWDDILKQKGIIPEKTPEELAEEQLKELVEETVEAYDPHEHKSVAQLDEDLEEADSDEERILQSYREQRLEQMKADSMKPKYGPGLKYISADDWKHDVTDAPSDVYVVIHLFQEAIEACEVMHHRLLELSAKFRSTKFIRCKATDAIKNYPDSKCPTVLIYKEGKVLKQFVGLKSFIPATAPASSIPTADDIEWALSRLSAVESDMVEPPRKESSRFNIRRM